MPDAPEVPVMPLSTVPDHVAVAVPDMDAADARWRDELGGRWTSWYHNRAAAFRSRQLRFAGGAKLELIQPSENATSEQHFVRKFLSRFGCKVHHVTLKVPDLLDAVDSLAADGIEVVDVFTDDDYWQEAFIRPSVVGGMIVQIAWARYSDDEWAEHRGITPEPIPADGAVLLGPRIAHPDLERARRLWELLGARVTPDGPGLLASWGEAPLSVQIVAGERAGPLGLRFANTHPLPAEDGIGPAVLVG